MSIHLKSVTSASTEQKSLDKRVLYNAGLLLGVSEFRDEQNYVLNRAANHQQLLHGYGTVYGLNVTVDLVGTEDLKISVAPGMGVDRLGRSFTINDTQCANIKEWVNGLSEADKNDFRTAGAHTIYVVARYHEVEVDPVLLIGQPCADVEGDDQTPSRKQDSFYLALVKDVPPMPLWNGWEKLRSSIDKDMTEQPTEALSSASSKAAKDSEAPPVDMFAKLNEVYRKWILNTNAEESYLTAFLAAEATTAQTHPEILLAQINFETTDRGWYIPPKAPLNLKDNSQRPIVLSTQALQALPFAATVKPPEPIDIEAEFRTRRILPFVTITPLEAKQVLGTEKPPVTRIEYLFECWFHLDITANKRTVNFVTTPRASVYRENNSSDFIGGITSEREFSIENHSGGDNTSIYKGKFAITADADRNQDVSHLRFVFPIGDFKVTNAPNAPEISLDEYMVQNNILFDGYRYIISDDGTRVPEIVVYVRNPLQPPSLQTSSSDTEATLVGSGVENLSVANSPAATSTPSSSGAAPKTKRVSTSKAKTSILKA